MQNPSTEAPQQPCADLASGRRDSHGGGLGKGGDVTLYYDGKAVGTGRVEQTEPMAFSCDEACDVGVDTGSPTSPDYGPHQNKFSGKIDWVKFDIGEDSLDHLITAEDKLNIAMSRQ